MKDQLTPNEAVEEAIAILDRGYHNASITKDGTVTRFHAGWAEISYSLDGGKTMHKLGAHCIGDVEVPPESAGC